MATIKTFPQVIFVTVEEDGSDDWLSANLTKRDSLGDSYNAIVGVYQFVSAEDVSEGPTLAKKRKSRATK